MQPLILLSGTNQSRANHEAAVTAAGGLPHSRYLPEPEVQNFAGLILCGGGDLDPACFGQPDQGSRDVDRRRDEVELALVARFLEANRPILGICRGMQVLNVALGGDLIQDLPAPLRAGHTSDGQGDLLHPVIFSPGTVLAQLYPRPCLVNSAHHQAVSRLGRGLRPAALSEDGCVEGLVHASLPLWGVQWHPERLCLAHARPEAADGMRLFRFFLAACRR